MHVNGWGFAVRPFSELLKGAGGSLSLRPLALLSNLQSSFLKIKSPRDPFAWAGKPCADNASQTPHRHFHAWFLFPCFSFVPPVFSHTILWILPIWWIFTVDFLFSSATFSLDLLFLVCCGVFLFLISMVTLPFPGIMEAKGLGGVKADGWLSHK